MHPHAIEGALVSLAAMWRLPVIQSADPEHSLRILRFLADQGGRPPEQILRRFDRKPKRLASRRLFLLQALPGVGPALTDCSVTSALSSALSPSTPPLSPRFEGSAQRRQRASVNCSLGDRPAGRGFSAVVAAQGGASRSWVKKTLFYPRV